MRRIAAVTLWIGDNLICGLSLRRKIQVSQLDETKKSGGANRRRSVVQVERFHVSNLIYRGRRHRPVTERIRRWRRRGVAATRLACIERKLERRPWHVQRSYFLAKSQSRQRRYCHVRVMNSDGETERSVGQYIRFRRDAVKYLAT